MTIIYSKTAAKTIAQLDIKTKQRIRQAIVKPLRGGSSLYRLRVGDRHTVFLYPDADTARQIQQSNSAKSCMKQS